MSQAVVFLVGVFLGENLILATATSSAELPQPGANAGGTTAHLTTNALEFIDTGFENASPL